MSSTNLIHALVYILEKGDEKLFVCCGLSSHGALLARCQSPHVY